MCAIPYQDDFEHDFQEGEDENTIFLNLGRSFCIQGVTKN